jgi:hypothetical protein
MDIILTLHEVRVLGSLIEKEVTTPDQYPISINALVNACNQKSNRDPVLELDEATVQETLDDLIKRHLVMEKSGFGSRVPKYQHRFADTQFSEFSFDRKELAVICVLFLRSLQTPGELRSRTHRFCKFNDVQEVERTLRELMERPDGPFVAKLPRESGRRESRYAHLFSGPVSAPAAVERPVGVAEDPSNEDDTRLFALEQRVKELAEEVEQMKRQLATIATTTDASPDWEG